MKSTQTGTGGPRKENIYSQQHSASNSQNGNSANAGQPQGVLANYTLPGVISYLTSEFTNLERFKIMANLEKSEMKYRIQQLTSELNSVRFLNEKQAQRIKLLESQLEARGDVEIKENIREVGSSGSNSSSKDSKDGLSDDFVGGAGMDISVNGLAASLEKVSVVDSPADSVSNTSKTGSKAETPVESSEIPHVNLDFLRDSRHKLNQSIREIVSLLEPPSSVDFLEPHASAATLSELESLLDTSKPSAYVPEYESRPQPKHDPFARYTLRKDDVLTGERVSFENGFEEAKEAAGNDEQEMQSSLWGKPQHEISITDESDTETVSLGEADETSLLNGIESS